MVKLCTPINIDENSKVNFMLANSPEKKKISYHNIMTENKSINIYNYNEIRLKDQTENTGNFHRHKSRSPT